MILILEENWFMIEQVVHHHILHDLIVRLLIVQYPRKVHEKCVAS